MVYVCDAQKTTMATTDVSVDAAMASELSELECICSLNEKQRTTLKAFLGGKNVFVLLPTDLVRV